MIDEKLNKSLEELEKNLFDMKTLIDTNKELSSGVSSYVDALNKLTIGVSDITGLIKTELLTTADSFSKKCDEIVKSAEDSVGKMQNSASAVENTVSIFTERFNDVLSYFKKASYAIIALICVGNIAAITAVILLFLR